MHSSCLMLDVFSFAMERLSFGNIFRTTLVLAVVCAGLMQPFVAAVKIISPLENLIIKYRNQSVLFNCTVTPANSSRGSFEWLKDKIPLQPDDVQVTSLWSSFELKNLSVQEEGEYTCIYGRSSDSVKVYLALKPNTTNVGERSPVIATVDESPELQCVARGWPRPIMFWMKDNRNISENHDHSQYEIATIPEGDDVFSVKSVLTIGSVQKEDKGKYCCVAANAAGVDKYSITVAVKDRPTHFKPTMTADQPKYSVERGKDATLVCQGEDVKEDVLTFLHWELNGTKIDTSSSHYKANKVFTHQKDGATPRVRVELTIVETDYVDEGNYSCVLRSGDTKRASDNMILEVKPRGRSLEDWLIVLICVVLLLLILLLGLLICMLWKRMKRKRKMATLAQKYGREAHDKNFEKDVFVSYSSKDYDWIKDFLQPLFDQNNINYIIHSRDFKPGKSFIENMADSIYNSRKVIVVMSPNYLCSGFCKDELNMALFRSAQRDDDSLIVVKIVDMKPAEIPKILRHKTFIDYTSKEETATWESRILDYVRSANRLLSVASYEATDASDRISLILNAFRIKRKKRQHKRMEARDQSLA